MIHQSHFQKTLAVVLVLVTMATLAYSEITMGPIRWDGENFEEIVPGGFKMKMIYVQSGTFEMGGDEKKSVSIKGFWIGETEVTQAQYQALIGANPSSPFKGNDKPVTDVSWLDAIAFCKKLSQKSGRQYSLPTEAQWEYACRAGSKGSWCFGDDESRLGEYAWFDKNSEGEPHPVRQKKPNAWGIYDMHGNVAEWCYSRLYNDDADLTNYDIYKAVDRPLFDKPIEKDWLKSRGGSYFRWASDTKCYRSTMGRPDEANDVVGFRVVCYE